MGFCRVVKVGGSLEDLPDLPQRLAEWLTRQTECDQLLLAGGGRLADQVRQQDRQLHLPVETAHWLAVHAMAVNGKRLEQSLRERALSARSRTPRLRTCWSVRGRGSWMSKRFYVTGSPRRPAAHSRTVGM